MPHRRTKSSSQTNIPVLSHEKTLKTGLFAYELEEFYSCVDKVYDEERSMRF